MEESVQTLEIPSSVNVLPDIKEIDVRCGFYKTSSTRWRFCDIQNYRNRWQIALVSGCLINGMLQLSLRRLRTRWRLLDILFAFCVDNPRKYMLLFSSFYTIFFREQSPNFVKIWRLKAILFTLQECLLFKETLNSSACFSTFRKYVHIDGDVIFSST